MNSPGEKLMSLTIVMSEEDTVPIEESLKEAKKRWQNKDSLRSSRRFR